MKCRGLTSKIDSHGSPSNIVRKRDSYVSMDDASTGSPALSGVSDMDKLGPIFDTRPNDLFSVCLSKYCNEFSEGHSD